MGNSERQIAEQGVALQRQTSFSMGAPEADLDTLGPASRKLARRAQAGREARSALLTDGERVAHRSAIRRYHTALGRRQQHRDRVRAAALTLACTEPADEAHLQAAHDFAVGVYLEKDLTGRLDALGDWASRARAELEEDDTARAANKPVLDAGDKAEKELEELLRGRLAEATRVRVPLPTWFVTVLGPAPSSERTQHWMDLAVRVLVYRAIYETTDPVVALGAHPADAASGRKAWYEELTQALRRWS